MINWSLWMIVYYFLRDEYMLLCIYFVSKKSWPNLNNNQLYKMGPDYLDRQYILLDLLLYLICFARSWETYPCSNIVICHAQNKCTHIYYIKIYKMHVYNGQNKFVTKFNKLKWHTMLCLSIYHISHDKASLGL